MDKIRWDQIEEKFVAVWCVAMPVTGTLLIPAVQGTVPAYMMAFASVLFVFFRLRSARVSPAVIAYGKSALVVAVLWLVLFVMSQIGLLTSDRHDFCGVNMIDAEDTRVAFRGSLFTQSIYLTACVLIALYFRYFFKESWMRYVFYSGYFLAGYGIYEWTYYLILHKPGDFLVNRSFGGGEHSASWSQSVDFGAVHLLRIKSTLGEPSFFAAAVLPFLFLAMDYRKVVLTSMLVFTALLSTSTSCYGGLIACLAVRSVWTGRINVKQLVLPCVVGLFLWGLSVFFPETFDGIFGQKLSGENDSGKSRMDAVVPMNELLGSFTTINWLFGIGFGYIYVNVFRALMVNTGLVGLGAFLYAIGRPLLFLPIKPGSQGLKLGLVAFCVLFQISVSELFIPTTWMFIGLSWWKLDQLRQARQIADARSLGIQENALRLNR